MWRWVSLVIVVAAIGVTLHAQRMSVIRNGSQPAVSGAAETFTGQVAVQPLFGATEHTRASAGQVTFAPGARSAWHTHPAGQHLIVTSGVGWVQAWGSEKGDPARGRGLDSTGGEALARCHSDERHDAYRHSRASQR
jgi:hypothetical protein